MLLIFGICYTRNIIVFFITFPFDINYNLMILS